MNARESSTDQASLEQAQPVSGLDSASGQKHSLEARFQERVGLSNRQDTNRIRKRVFSSFDGTVDQRDVRLAAEDLRDIAAKQGLGVAMLVAHLHGLFQGHIPLSTDPKNKPLEKQAIVVEDKGESPFLFVNVPIRAIRSDTDELIAREIMNRRPKTSGFVYHEDGLIGTYSLDSKKMSSFAKADFSQTDGMEILTFLECQGVLRRANVNSMQVHFKDIAAKHFIEAQNEPVFVRGKIKPEQLILPGKYDSAEMHKYLVGLLKLKGPCNYCSCRELNPLEITLDSAELKDSPNLSKELRTVRNYMFGFTFAPFGDPREVMHFLSWDYPHINDVVNNMDPQSYSFSDLIKLVNIINDDVERFCGVENLPSYPISGICNHWAGNSIYHQHYQYFCIPELPMPKAEARYKVTAYRNVSVSRLEWGIPAYRIKAGREASVNDLMFVADKVANEWGLLNHGDVDVSYGNGIKIRNHTQNTLVTRENGQAVAYFIPRLRTNLDSTNPENVIQKKNAAVLEVTGYFLVDNTSDMELLHGVVPEGWFDSLMKKHNQTYTSKQVVASLQEAGYLSAGRQVNSDRLAAEELKLNIVVSPELVKDIHSMLKMVITDAKGRKELAQRWLNEWSPGQKKIQEFETSLKSFLEEKVVYYERAMKAAANHQSVGGRKRVLMELMVEIKNDFDLNGEKTLHLLELLNQAYMEMADVQRSALLTKPQIDKIIAEKQAKQSRGQKSSSP